VIGRERGSDDRIITRTNGTHVTPVIVVIIIQSSLPLSRLITGVTYVPFVVVIIQSSLPLSRSITGVTCVSCDDWIITTTNGTHVTPVIDRERGSDDWIITTTNRTHVTAVIGRERGSDDWIITRTNGTYR
jgi:hypothetical protein